MSTIRTVNIQHPSSSTPSITMDSTGAMTGSFPYPNRNLIYNGAMQINQRSASTASITNGGYYTADRWLVSTEANMFGTWTQSVENDAPTGSGLRRSLKMVCTTADATPAAGDYIQVVQLLEGQDLQRIAKGTSSAQQLTLSFWVKSNVTGTYIAELRDVDNSNRTVAASYTISASATWERKTITFPADTTGAFDNDNAASLSLGFWLGAGSTYNSGSSLGTTWNTTTNTRAVGGTNLAAATNNYWQITGVQLETGSVATPFEFKSFGQELRECQRYYCKSFPVGTAPADNQGGGVGSTNSATQNFFSVAQVSFPVEMRAAPTITYYNPSAVNANKIRDASGLNYPAYTQVGPTSKGFTVAVNNTSFMGGGTLGFTNYVAEAEL